MRTKYLLQLAPVGKPARGGGGTRGEASGESLPEPVGDVPPREGAVLSDLIDCQKTVERMLSDGGTLPEVEGYVERCALDELEKAGLSMLAWAHQERRHNCALPRRRSRSSAAWEAELV